MLFRASVIAGFVVATGLTLSLAMAEDAGPPPSPVAVDGVDLTEPDHLLGGVARSLGLQIGVQETRPTSSRFIPPEPDWHGAPAPRRFEFSAAGASEQTGLPVDVSVHRRTSVVVDRNGDIGPTRQGAEVRVGRGLARLVQPWRAAPSGASTWYFFAASDDEAIAWAPGGSGANGGALRYQADRVEIGDMQAGLAMEAGGVHTAFAYVQRDIQGRYGSAEENFVGLTVTRRH